MAISGVSWSGSGGSAGSTRISTLRGGQAGAPADRDREAALGRQLAHARLALTELVADLVKGRAVPPETLDRLARERLWAPQRLAALESSVADLEPAWAARHRARQRLASAAAALRGARQELAESQVGLVVLIARRHGGRGLSLPDLIQEGHLGLLTAIDRFEPERGLRLSTYAQWWIRQVIGRAVRMRADLVRPPVRSESHRRQVAVAAAELSHELQRRPDEDEIAERADLEAAEVRAVRQQPRPERIISLSGGARDEGGPPALPDLGLASPLEQAHRRQLRQVVSESFRHLRQRERAIVALRYGLLDTEAQTLEEIGRRMNLSRERVRQIEGQALRKLRRHARLSELGTGALG